MATQFLPAYFGLIERINLYSLMVLNIVMAFWMFILTDNIIKLEE